MLGKDEEIAEKFKDYLREHIAELAKECNMTKRELDDYIERIMVA